MLNKEKHQLVMGQVLRDIYSDVSIAPLIGFKGDTCAYFFYGLPRFSVDLGFDLFPSVAATQKLVYEKIRGLLGTYGEIKDNYIKQNTLFFLLSYGDTDHNIKIEVNARILTPDIRVHYELKEYLGISMFVARKDYLFASKLVALLDRKLLAMRDIYDIWFFAKNNWDINADVIKARTNKTIKERLADCLSVIEEVKDSQILQGLGELLSEKGKVWVKNNLRKDTVFLLKNYMSVLK